LIDAITAKVEHLQQPHFNVDPIGIFDSLVDQEYVNGGFANLLGLDLQKGFDEVHRSNLSKFDKDGSAIFRYDGKLMKGPDYVAPNLHKVYETYKFTYKPL
jgi:predicted HAD superfamily Cof-like phosphohydrolase